LKKNHEKERAAKWKIFTGDFFTSTDSKIRTYNHKKKKRYKKSIVCPLPVQGRAEYFTQNKPRDPIGEYYFHAKRKQGHFLPIRNNYYIASKTI